MKEISSFASNDQKKKLCCDFNMLYCVGIPCLVSSNKHAIYIYTYHWADYVTPV